MTATNGLWAPVWHCIRTLDGNCKNRRKDINFHRLPMRTPRITLMFYALALLAPRHLPAQEAPVDPVLHWMDQIAQSELQAREDAIAQIQTVAQAEKRKQYVRAKLVELMGGLPEYHGPLNARITGRIQGDGYMIEKLIFESLPGIYVTANVYRPSPPGRYPGILFQSGHTMEGKAEPQLTAANLALKGFVVLCPDPIGQGERLQSFDRQLGRSVSPMGGSGNDHVQLGAQAMLVGQASTRYWVWDAKRALDYLESRPDVDASRLGAVGCSGGGSATTFVGALDSRLKVVAPGCFTQTYRLMFTGPDPDSEMEFPRLLASGLDHADFAELAAPTPWLFLATEHDYYSPPGVEIVYDEVRRWYKLYGAEDKVRYFLGSGPHGTPPETRAAIYEWMIRWLKDGKGDFLERDVHLYTNHELLVTKTGQVEDEPGARKVYQVIRDDLRAHLRQGTSAELQEELRRLQIPTDGSAPAIKVVDESTSYDVDRQHIRYESEPGIDIDADLYTPTAPGRKSAVLLVRDRSSNPWTMSTEDLAEKMAKAGRVVLEMEPRDSPLPRQPYNAASTNCFPCVQRFSLTGNWLSNDRADLIGRNMPAMRTHDLLRAVDLLAARSDVDAASIRAFGRGIRGIYVLLAAAADARIGRVWVDRTPYSLRLALDNSVNINLFDAAIPGFILHWDLADLKKAMASRAVLWTDPSNWTGQVLPLGTAYQYRYVLGDNNDLAHAQDREWAEQLMR